MFIRVILIIPNQIIFLNFKETGKKILTATFFSS